MKTKILVVVGISLLLIGYNSYYSPHYSDGQMERHFRAYEEDFNRLVEMFSEDTQISWIIDSDTRDNVMPTDLSVYPPPTREQLLSEERYEEYLGLLRKLNLRYTISRNQEAGLITLTYTYSSTEPDQDGYYKSFKKGYAYSRKPLSRNLRGSLDSGEIGYKRINNNWYLYSEEGFGKPE